MSHILAVSKVTSCTVLIRLQSSVTVTTGSNLNSAQLCSPQQRLQYTALHTPTAVSHSAFDQIFISVPSLLSCLHCLPVTSCIKLLTTTTWLSCHSIQSTRKVTQRDTAQQNYTA